MSSPSDSVNAAQAAGEHRVMHAALLDDEIRPHNERFRVAARVGPGDRVLDIGCGTGQSTREAAREAARAAAGGSVLGVDLSAPAIELARQLTVREGLSNVSYQRADAQVHPFPAGYFDLCISRFGTMFFADPVAAFANIGTALRPGGRLVMLVWQTRERNEWSTAIRRAIAGPDVSVPEPAAPSPGPEVHSPGSGVHSPGQGVHSPGQVPHDVVPGAHSPGQVPHDVVPGAHSPGQPAGRPDPFALGDPESARGVLAASGFIGVGFAEVDEPVYYGPDPDVAYDLVLGLRDPKELLNGLDAAAAGQARQRLRAVLADHDTGGGVYFGSRAWIVTARRPGPP
jgi:SAM-dependent methyltransferase